MRRFLTDEKGQAMSEYGLVLGIIAVGTIGVLIALRDKLKELFQAITDTLKTQ